MKQRINWLPHIYNALTKDTFGYTVTPYSIALEGWRRGLELTFHQTKLTKSMARYTLSDGEKSHTFVASRGDLVSREAMKICKNKFETKMYLKKAGLPIPEGAQFDSSVSDKIIITFANELGYPLVVKPTEGTGGRGVITNIRNENELKKNLTYIRDELGYKDVIVESYFKGEDYRVYIVGKDAVAVTKRIPPNVIGDGKSTIKSLINEKNKMKKLTEIYKSSLIKIDKELEYYLEKSGLSLLSVPGKGERIFVKSKNNVSVGGDPIDATDELFPKAKQIAIDALNSIPNIPQGGVDILVNHETQETIILEINSQANIRLNLFPMEGPGRDIPKAIVDFYFPKTKQNLESTIFFDFGKIWNELKKGKSKQITVPQHIGTKLKLKRYIVNGDVRNIGYAKWIKEIAKECSLNGYVKHLENGNLSIVISGDEINLNKFNEIIRVNAPKRYNQFNIVELNRKRHVLQGFVIKGKKFDDLLEDGYFPVRLQDPGKGSKLKKIRKLSINKTDIDYEKEYNKLINSTSWRITKPLRKLGKLLKK